MTQMMRLQAFFCALFFQPVQSTWDTDLTDRGEVDGRGFSFLQVRHSQQPTIELSDSTDDSKVAVKEVGDHSMKLSDGQSFASLNTGVVLAPDFAGVWSPKDNQHKIRMDDIDLVAKAGVKKIFIGKGVVGDGVAELMQDALTRVEELRGAGVSVFIGNTYDAARNYNAHLEKDAAGTVGALFHTGCL
mmetsp:Transcript_50477/g.80112  ORF Transcript_50477/g.80112 Transcript_50477/m.80112 type:complete len:188 (-) Transcript_50477:10-573(-)